MVSAIQAEISDTAALEFTRTFYRALAEARTAIWISIPNTLEWGTPVLYLRAPDGVLFDMAALLVTPTTPIVQLPPSSSPPPISSAKVTPPQMGTTLQTPQETTFPSSPTSQQTKNRVGDGAERMGSGPVTSGGSG